MCPRHPDRVSYVRCQRCDRPACPECQRPAAVGVQCVDCVAQASKGRREARTALGGRIGDGRPVVTWGLIAVCVLVYVAQRADPMVTQQFAYLPFATTIEPWRMITAAFLHSPSSIIHILFNMYALFLFGPYLESLLGRWRFMALYLVTAFAGSVGYLLLTDPMRAGGVVGASGAVFGLFGALVVVQRRLQQQSRQVLVLLALNFGIGFVIPNIAWQAHLGGAVAGAALGAVFAYAPRQHRAVVGVAGAAGVVAVLVALTLLRVG